MAVAGIVQLSVVRIGKLGTFSSTAFNGETFGLGGRIFTRNA
jgi:hypothetical protein